MEHSHHYSPHHSEQEHNNHKQHQHHGSSNKTDNTSGHDKHAGHHTQDFLKRFWICLILTVPILLLSEMIQHWFGFHISFPGAKYVLLLLGTVVYIYGGMAFLKGMVSEIRDNAI